MDKYQERANLLNQMRAFTDAHPEMSDTQVTEYETIEAKFDKIDAAIKREEALKSRETNISAATSTALIGDVPVKETNKDDYKAAFDKYVATGSLSDIKAAMTVGVAADGGYIVPTEYHDMIIAKLNTIGRTRGISNVIRTAATTNFAVEGDAPTFAWVTEGGAYGETKSTFGQKTLNAFKLGGIIKVSEELLQDNFINFDAYMSGQIAKGIDKAESTAFAVGTGSGQPEGYATNAATGTNSTTAATAAVTADELIDIYYDLKEEYRANASWRMTDMTEKAIRKLKNSNGDYIYSPAMSDGERPTLLGRPIVIDPDMAEIGAGNKFVIIGDFANYQIADRGEMSIQRLDELYAGNGLIGFKVSKRVDGKPMLAEAFNAGKNAAA